MRRYSRVAVESCMPLGLQLIDDRGQPFSPWTLADILDISLGGLCLLLDRDFPLPEGQLPSWVRLDLRHQPGFGIPWLPASIRASAKSQYALSLGVAFERALITLPTLVPCRRSQRRELDPSFLVA